jgi:hypothetical protein
MTGQTDRVARVVSDYTIFAWLCDVFIHEDYRAHGLGKWLIQTVMATPTCRDCAAGFSPRATHMACTNNMAGSPRQPRTLDALQALRWLMNVILKPDVKRACSAAIRGSSPARSIMQEGYRLRRDRGPALVR